MSEQHHLFSADHVVPLARLASKALTAALMRARINRWVFFAFFKLVTHLLRFVIGLQW
jgi:hypothetical protein